MGTPEKRIIMSKAHKGEKRSPEAVKKSADGNRQAYIDRPELRKRLSDVGKGKVISEETKEKLRVANKGQKHSPEQDAAHSVRMKKLWDDPVYKEVMSEKIFKALAFKPTKPEAYLDALLQTYFPDRWIYNGDNSCHFKIDFKVPDFLSLDNLPKVIELFSYHHCPALNKNIRPHAIARNRVELFKEHGYDTLIVWEPELKKPDKVVAKIKEFMEAS